MPVVFWDEFDCKNYDYLAHFLAPMQDGKYLHGSEEHPVGKAVFIFAGETCHTMHEFLLIAELVQPDTLDQLSHSHSRKEELTVRRKSAQGKKILDFVSRLRGYVNIGQIDMADSDIAESNSSIGLEQAEDVRKSNNLCKFKRAILIHGKIKEYAPHLLQDESATDEEGRSPSLDLGVIYALLNVRSFQHGARSLEAIIRTSDTRSDKFRRSALPPSSVLELHIKEPNKFLDLVRAVPDRQTVLSRQEKLFKEIQRTLGWTNPAIPKRQHLLAALGDLILITVPNKALVEIEVFLEQWRQATIHRIFMAERGKYDPEDLQRRYSETFKLILCASELVAQKDSKTSQTENGKKRTKLQKLLTESLKSVSETSATTF